VQSQSCTYDLLGNPLSRSDANTNLSESFTYDALSRLTSTTVNLPPGPLQLRASRLAVAARGEQHWRRFDLNQFSYDPNGNQRVLGGLEPTAVAQRARAEGVIRRGGRASSATKLSFR
jgi:YD repeat-containing protein